MGRKIFLGVIVAVILIGVLVCVFGGQAAQQVALQLTPTAPADSVEPEPRQITAKGEIVPARWANLSFETSGVIQDVLVKEGDRVQAGDVLVRLATARLELAVSQAEVALQGAQAQLALEQAQPAAVKVAAAQAVVSSTQAAYWDAAARYKNRDAQQVIDDAEVKNARKALEDTQWQYDTLMADRLTSGWVEHTGIGKQLEEAQNAYNVALARARLNKNDSGLATLQQAAADLARAKADLYALQHPTTTESVAVRQAEIRKAELALEQARFDLEHAHLTAPFNGTVAQVSVRAGEPASPGAMAIVLADLSQLMVETTDLDEWGAAHIQVGQAVKIVINALDDAELTGVVTAIAPKSVTLSTGDIAYTATIALTATDPRLRWGMTVKVIFSE